MKKKVLEIKNLTKYYGNILAVDNLSLTLNEGEIFGFIGPNGAGKSTTIRAIMNLINKNEGIITLYDEELTKDNVELKKLIGYLPSEINLYEDLTVKEMLDYHESFFNKNIHKRRCDLVERLKLDETKRIEELSLGNLKKVGIVLAFMHEPKLLILDEATSGLDPIMQQTFYELLKEEKEKGTTIFYSTHILGEISKICNRVGIIKEGKLLKIETIEEMQTKNLNYVTIKSKEIKEITKDLNLDITEIIDDTIKFKNHKSTNELIKILAKYNIDKLLIEEATLEDVFIHYYK